MKSNDSKSGGQNCDKMLQEWCENSFLYARYTYILFRKNCHSKHEVLINWFALIGFLINIYIRQTCLFAFIRRGNVHVYDHILLSFFRFLFEFVEIWCGEFASDQCGACQLALEVRIDE